jgi:hypothetical protein
VLVSASSLFCAFLFLKYDWTCISLRENYFCTFFYLIKSGLKAYPLFPTEGTHGGPPEVRHIDGEAAGCPARVMVLESRSRFWHMATFFFFSFMCLKVTLFALHVSTSQIDVERLKQEFQRLCCPCHLLCIVHFMFHEIFSKTVVLGYDLKF